LAGETGPQRGGYLTIEFTIKQKVLNEALSAIGGSIQAKETIPVLSNVLIETMGEAAIRITGTDLDITIRRTVEADVKSSGSICILAKKLAEVVRMLPDKDCHFVVDKKNWVTLTCGSSKYRFGGTLKDKFPNVEKFECDRIQISGDILQDVISHTAFATSNESSRYALQGGKVEIEKGNLRLVCCDGYQMSVAERSIDSNGVNLETLIPKKALNEAGKLDAKEIAFGTNGNHIFFETDDQLIVARTLTGQFPNYQKMLPTDSDSIALVNVGEFVAAVRRASTVAAEVLNGHGKGRSVRVQLKPGQMLITSSSPTEGEGEEIIDIDYAGDEILFRFDSRRLPAWPATFPAEKKFKLKFADAQVGVEFNLDGDDAYQYILMPMKI
jgi:DNA polymerase-3 subunit beta